VTEPVDHLYTIVQAQDDIAAAAGLVDRMGEAHSKTDATDPPNQPAAGLTSYSLTGHEKYASSDGADYNTGRNTVVISSATTFNSTSFTTVASLPVAAITYRVEAGAHGTMGGTAAAQAMGIDGPSTSLVKMCSANWKIITSGSSVFTTKNQALATDFFIAAHSANSDFWLEIRGMVTFTAAGTLVWQGRAPVAANTWTLQGGSFIDLMPVT
jgi:hypothetical protein